MSNLKLLMVATRPVLCARGEFKRGQLLRARDQREFDEYTARPSWRKASKLDLGAWRDRLTNDPVMQARKPLAKVESDSESGELGKAILAAAEGANNADANKSGKGAGAGKSLVS